MRRLHKWLLPLAALFKLPVSPLIELHWGKACVCANTQTRFFRRGLSFEIHRKYALSITVIKAKALNYAFMYCMRAEKSSCDR